MKLLPAAILTLSLAAPALSADPLAVSVSSDFRSVNGTTEIPTGLFGVHATKLTPELREKWGIESVRLIHQAPSGVPVDPGSRPDVPVGIQTVIECFYDRYQPARLLTDKDWKANLEKLARTYAQHAQMSGKTRYIEFWNEPFLNWAAKPGVNYDPVWYETKDRVEGGPVTLKGASQPTEFLVWSKKLLGVDAKTGQIDYLAASYAPQVITTDPNASPPTTRPAQPGDTYTFRNKKEMRLETLWWAKDTTQKSYYSGKQNSLYYRQMLLPFAQALKENFADVQLAAGWGFQLNAGNWSTWEDLYKPFIDALLSDPSKPLLDAIHEHHYGGDTRLVPATYEVFASYAQTTYNKSLKFWNTEAGGFLDPERPDTPAKPKLDYTTPLENFGRCTYTLRDILYTLDSVPDKALFRASHAAGAQSDGIAFEFLRPLRGKLLKTHSPDPSLWCVASLPQRGKRAVALFNDRNQPRDIALTVATPESPPTGATLSTIQVTPTGLNLHVADLKLNVDKNFTASVTIPAKSAVLYQITTAPNPAGDPFRTLSETQFFANAILQKVEKGQSLKLTITLPKEAFANPASTTAALRLFPQNYSPKKGTITLNGTPLPITPTHSGLHIQPLDLALLREKNELLFTCLPDAESPYTIAMASLVLTRPAPASTP